MDQVIWNLCIVCGMVLRGPCFAGGAQRLQPCHDTVSLVLYPECMEPMDKPIMAGLDELTPPQEAEAMLRQVLPPWQLNSTSDDYVEYTWHAPTVRLFIGRPKLEPPEPGFRYPEWTSNALGGFASAIDPMVFSASRCIGATVIDLLTDTTGIDRAQAEFKERTGGGVGGSKWVAPLLPGDFQAPIHYRWPEYVSTIRGDEWWIPERA